MKILRDEKLENYTHAASISDAEDLADYIRHAQEEGYEVKAAWVRGKFVPTCYKFTWGMVAPGWNLRDGDLHPVYFDLETRCCGRGARFGMILIVPTGRRLSGWRCIRKEPLENGKEKIELRG